MSILIKNAQVDGKKKDIYIENNIVKLVASEIEVPADEVINANGKVAIPGFANCHTHAAMTLFRGFGDDMPLMKWLHDKIWPNEAKLTDEDVYWGSKLALLEMIQSGTTVFADMYMRQYETKRAAEEMGVRCLLSYTFFDHFEEYRREVAKEGILNFVKSFDCPSGLVKPAIAPHAVYTVSGELLKWVDGVSAEYDIPIHIHLAETDDEQRFCLERFGTTPVRYLNSIGVLSPRLIAAHVIYADDEELRMLADNGVKVVHNPASNMKLGSGTEFEYVKMIREGITVGLGTDGCSSSNNLDMVEAMKLASLMGKGWRKDPEAVSAHQIFKTATEDGYKVVGVNGGVIEEGRVADLSLVDIHRPQFVPNHDFVSNLVYAANGSCVDTVIINGRVVMRNGKVNGADEIMSRAGYLAERLVSR